MLLHPLVAALHAHSSSRWARCLKRRGVGGSGAVDAWEVDFADSALAPQGAKPQAELDPPPGPRLRWLDEKLSQHAFVVLLFYRGFW